MGSNLNELVQNLGVAFDGFKAQNDQRLEVVENALALSQARGFVGGSAPDAPHKGYGLLGPQDKKDYKALFGTGDQNQWDDQDTSFFAAIFGGRSHPGLKVQGLSEGIPSDGGYLIPTEQEAEIHTEAI